MDLRNSYNKIMFRPIVAKSYYIIEHDGKYIQSDYSKDNSGRFFFLDGSGNSIELKNPGDGGTKTYFRRVEKELEGIVVGFKDIVIKAKLFLGERRDEDGNTLSRFIGKEREEVVKSALVYYANMKSHWVPLEDIFECQTEGEQISFEFEDTVQKADTIECNPYIIIERSYSNDDYPFGFSALSDDDIPF